jgi:selenocysteine-specific elongation factor
MPNDKAGVKHFILATAGHVDHGKTALIKALTGIDTDRLPEEKVRGITIDLGFAHLALPGFSIGVIDVPGHEDFVRNMIAGVGSVDLALFVVAADDGWMPQTEEHLQILLYLGVTRAVVALTKRDLGNAETRREEIRARLRETPFASAPIVPTSVRSQTGIAELKETLAHEFEALPAPRDFGNPRLFVDRVFTVRGSGTIVTGTLSGGRFSRGENVLVQPQKISVRIRSLQSHNRPLEVAGPGTRVALNLVDVDPEQIARGSTISAAQSGAEPTRTLDVILERSFRLPAATRPIKSGATLSFHFSGARRAAQVQLRDRGQLLPNESTIARLRLAAPVFAFVGDRFVLRDSSEQLTIAGGTVFDARPGGIKLRSLEQRALLDARAGSPNDCRILLQTQLQRDQFALRAHLLMNAPFSLEEENAALDALRVAGLIFLDEKIAADASWWKMLRQTAMKLVEAEHAAHPEQTGLEMTRLRNVLGVANADIFDALLRELARDGYIQTRNVLRRATHRPALPPALQPAGDRIRAVLRARPLDPPARTEIAPDRAALQALRFLCETGELVALSDDLVMTAEGFAQMQTMIEHHLRGGKSATVSELRQATGSTRRILVPLLERLDRLGLTIRQGDRRTLR